MKLKFKQINNFKEGDIIKGFFLCKSIENKVTRLGDEYIDLILEDSTGNIRGKVWSFVDTFKNRIINGMPVAIKGAVIKYNGTHELNISSINYADQNIYKEYGFNKNLLVKTINDDINSLYKELLNYISILSFDYKRISNFFLSTEFLTKFFSPYIALK